MPRDKIRSTEMRTPSEGLEILPLVSETTAEALRRDVCQRQRIQSHVTAEAGLRDEPEFPTALEERIEALLKTFGMESEHVPVVLRDVIKNDSNLFMDQREERLGNYLVASPDALKGFDACGSSQTEGVLCLLKILEESRAEAAKSLERYYHATKPETE